MLSRINHGWRWLGTAVSFFVFGLGGLVLSVCFGPLMAILPGNALQRRRRARILIQFCFRGFVWLMRSLGVLTYEIKGLHKLEGKSNLILANHPSLIDVVFLIALIPNANCIVKGRLLRNPFTRSPILAAGYIANETAEGVVAAAAQSFNQGYSLIVFPEGTRTQPGVPFKFKRGAANLALRTGADVSPVVIRCQPTTLTKQDRWYQVPKRRVHFTLEVGDQIDIDIFSRQPVPSLAARSLNDRMTDYFTKELTLDEQPTA